MIRAIKNSLFVAWRYLCFHWVRSIILIVALSIIIFVPVFLDMVVKESQAKLNTRAQSTPLVLGEKGSDLDLAVNSLYFILKRPPDFTMTDAAAVDDTGLAYTIPLYTRFRSGKYRIAGTSLDYFDFRELKLSKGRMFAILGEAVIGSRVAQELKLKVGDSIISSPENLFDLAGDYPLQMTIVGVLAPSGTADDEVIFADVATTWVMAGFCHGHEDLAKTKDSSVVLKRKDNLVVGNAKLKIFNVITPQNLKDFHFHGDKSTFPINAALVVPNDHKAQALLLGRYQNHPDSMQIIQPKNVVQELIQSIMRIKRTLDTVVFTVGVSTILTIVLVFLLSIRLREKEIQTIFRLGCSRMAIAGFIAAEVVIIAVTSIIIATFFVWIARIYSDAIMVQLLMQ